MNIPAEQANQAHTILLVDDSPVNLQLVVESLDQDGHEVLVALDGAEALQRAEIVLPDLILLDVMMPGMNGIDVCRRLKEQAGTRDIPVIFMTSLNGMQDKVAGFGAGAVDYVTKPLQLDEVRARIGAHLKLRDLQRQMEEKNRKLQGEIAERERVERALRRSQASLNQAQRIAQVGSWELDLVNNVLDWSDEIFRIFEIDREKFGASYQAFLAAIHPDDRETVGRAYADSLENRTPYEIEHRLLLADGRVKQVLERCETIYADDGSPLRSMGTVQDITARKQTEEMLLKREQEFRALAENSPDTIARYDRDCRRIYINPAFGRLAGKPTEAMLGVTPTHYYATPQAAEYETALRAAFESGNEGAHELSWLAHDGRTITSHIRIMPERAADGRVVSVLAVGRDITELKEVEQQLRTLTDNLPDAIVRYDRECRRTYVNPQWEKLNGLRSEQILGKRPVDLSVRIAPMSEQYQQKLMGVVEHGKPDNLELDWREADGSETIYDLRAIPEFGPDGQVVSVLTIARDISEIKQAEWRLKNSEREFRTLAENSPDAVVRYDRDCRFVYANPRVEKLLGRRIHELRGKTPSELPGLPEAEFFQQRVEEVVATGVPDEFEHLIQVADGGAVWGLVNIFPEFDEAGQVAFVQVLTRDITAIKEAERALEESRNRLRELAAQRESEQEDDRKRLAWDVHEGIGQNLMAMHLNLSLLGEKMGGQDPALSERVDALTRLVDGSIQQVRDVTRALRPRVLDLGIVTSLEWLAEQFMTETAVECRIVAEQDFELDDHSSTLLFRIAEEALSNVSRHAQAAQVVILLEKRSGQCCLEVRDDGKGFDLDSDVEGQSAGLAWLRERTASQGGEFVVFSHPGEGTIIEAMLPCREEGAEKP